MSNAESDFFEVTSVGEVTVIKLLDPPELPVLYVELSQQFRDELCAFLDTNKPTKVVLDFANLYRIRHQPVISTAMLGAFLAARKTSNSFGCQWRICGLTEVARDYYRLTSLHIIFPQLHSVQSDAVAAFSASVKDST